MFYFAYKSFEQRTVRPLLGGSKETSRRHECNGSQYLDRLGVTQTTTAQQAGKLLSVEG